MVATVSVFLIVGFYRDDKPTVNPKAVDDGYHPAPMPVVTSRLLHIFYLKA